jgi:hypothetical protein
LKKTIQNRIRQTGIDIFGNVLGLNALVSEEFPEDFNLSEIEIIKKTRKYTMTSPERIVSLIRAIDYIVTNDILGDIVECGVWKGGSMMAAAMTLKLMNSSDRGLHLFDTFDGMTEPGENDISYKGNMAEDLLKNSMKDENSPIWAYSTLDEVKSNLMSMGYDPQKIHFIKGKVEETIPDRAPEMISLLRLDTDWYESTLHELVHLYPKLSHGGVIIIDDYGHWQGARKATDSYLRDNNIKLFLNRIDYTGRIGVKD